MENATGRTDSRCNLLRAEPAERGSRWFSGIFWIGHANKPRMLYITRLPTLISAQKYHSAGWNDSSLFYIAATQSEKALIVSRFDRHDESRADARCTAPERAYFRPCGPTAPSLLSHWCYWLRTRREVILLAGRGRHFCRAADICRRRNTAAIFRQIEGFAPATFAR